MPDFSRAPVRKWWADSVFAVVDRGIDGLQSGKFLDLPADALVEPEGPPAVAANPYRAVFFGMADHATREGFREQQRDRRPVVWSGSLTPGSQRWAATDLPIPSGCTPRDSLREALSLSLSGQPLSRGRIPLPGSAGISLSCFIGVDSALPLVCGFLSFDPDSPYMSAAESAAALGSALTRRSRLIPYYYTLCFNAFRDCEPILRPLFFADPKDLTLRDRDDAFFVGPELLVVPKLEKDKPKPPCPLKGGWRKIAWSPEEGGDQPDLPDLYLRPGAILPLGPVMQWTSEKPLDPLTLLINLDSFGSATGVLYEDDGDGYGFYRNQCRRITYKAETKDGSVFIRLAGLDGGLPMPRRKMEVRLLTDAGEVTAIGSERGTLKIDLPKPP